MPHDHLLMMRLRLFRKPTAKDGMVLQTQETPSIVTSFREATALDLAAADKSVFRDDLEGWADRSWNVH